MKGLEVSQITADHLSRSSDCALVSFGVRLGIASNDDSYAATHLADDLKMLEQSGHFSLAKNLRDEFKKRGVLKPERMSGWKDGVEL